MQYKAPVVAVVDSMDLVVIKKQEMVDRASSLSHIPLDK
jgi:hypothetical protein